MPRKTPDDVSFILYREKIPKAQYQAYIAQYFDMKEDVNKFTAFVKQNEIDETENIARLNVSAKVRGKIPKATLGKWRYYLPKGATQKIIDKQKKLSSQGKNFNALNSFKYYARKRGYTVTKHRGIRKIKHRKMEVKK